MGMSNEENILPRHGETYLYPGFFSEQESDRFFEDLLKNIKWEQMAIRIFGKTVLQPRLTAWFADKGIHYTYSGLTPVAFEWTDALLDIKQRVEKKCGVTFNSALLNLYRNGKDSMGWHRDNEKALGRDPVVASVSFGATRNFRLRDYATKKEMIEMDLGHGSFLLMRGETQHFWEHAVPKTNKRVGERINITFRSVSGS
jgi:alkylated DNA repair dioxygenase AlkB